MTDNSIGQYFKEVRRYPLLKQGEEVTLGHKIKRMLKLKELNPLELSFEQLNEIKEGDKAFETFVHANLRLVIILAKNYTNRNLDLLSLIQFGNIGLMTAVKKFDPEQGNRFSTLAYWWIKQAIARGITNTGRTIRLPIHISDLLDSLNRVKRKLKQSTGREPTLEEIVEFYNGKAKEPITLKQAQFCFDSDRTINSLNAVIDPTENTELGDLICDDEEIIDKKILIEKVNEAVSLLPNLERSVVDMTYGLTVEALPPKKISKVLNIPEIEISGILSRSLEYLRVSCPELKEFL